MTIYTKAELVKMLDKFADDDKLYIHHEPYLDSTAPRGFWDDLAQTVVLLESVRRDDKSRMYISIGKLSEQKLEGM